MDQGSFPDLNETYKRRLGTTLTFLDRTICELEQMAMGRETPVRFVYREQPPCSCAARDNPQGSGSYT